MDTIKNQLKKESVKKESSRDKNVSVKKAHANHLLTRLMQGASPSFIVGHDASAQKSILKDSNIEHGALIYDFEKGDLVHRAVLHNLRPVLKDSLSRCIGKTYFPTPDHGVLYVLPVYTWSMIFNSAYCILIPLNQFRCSFEHLLQRQHKPTEFFFYMGLKVKEQHSYARMNFNDAIIPWTPNMTRWVFELQNLISKVVVY